MANIGDAVPQPETGWRRYNDDAPYIMYEGFSQTINQEESYGKTHMWVKSNNVGLINDFKMEFNFIGTSFRIVGSALENRSNNVVIKIDGESYSFRCNYSPGNRNTLLFQSDILKNGSHKVIIDSAMGMASGFSPFVITCLDINEDGFLTPELSRDYEFPVKVGDAADVLDYAAALIGGEEQLLITREGKLYLTKGDGTYIECSKVSSAGGSMSSTMLFDGNASSTGVYNLIDDINNYEYIYCELKSNVAVTTSIVPHMTSNIAPAPYKATASSATQQPYGAFNGIVGAAASTWYSSGIPSWIQIDTGVVGNEVSGFSIFNGSSDS